VFIPGSEISPQALDAAMRASLADSLVHIHAAAARPMNVSDAVLADGLSAIKTHRVSPGVFGRYYDVVLAVTEQRYEHAGALFREISTLADEEPAFAPVPFTEEALGADKERYARVIGLEATSPAALTSPHRDDWLAFEANVTAAMELIKEADPELAAELRALVAQVVAVVAAAPSSRSGGQGFGGGASSLMLWGAVLLNTERHRGRIEMIAGLVHEAAHQILFGLSIDTPLAENPISERYGSPLRTDPRPMDGIFHSTFVCARIHYAYARLRDVTKNRLDEAEQRLIDQRLGFYRQKFFDGLETVERFGRLSTNARRIIRSATDYMQSTN
jgi:HEXXH motif-containing protein